MNTQNPQGRQVVIITHSEDLTGMLGELPKELGDRGASVLRFNTDEFPVSGEVHFSQDDAGGRLCFRQGGISVELGPQDAVWYRRARWGGKVPMDMDPQLRHGCLEETEALLRGVLAAAPCFVLDPPELVRNRGHKPFQMRLAQSRVYCGMSRRRGGQDAVGLSGVQRPGRRAGGVHHRAHR
jgi:hypothetical protein